MPYYLFRDEESGAVWEEFLTITERTEFLEKNPRVTQLVNGFPGSVTGFNKKPDAGFRDLLKNMKKANSKGTRKSTIETF